MKSYMVIMIPAFYLVLASCNSQDISAEKVPSVIRNKVNEKFPGAQQVEWTRNKDLYEAEVLLNDSVDASLQLSATGDVLMQKSDIIHSNLPREILLLLQEKYSGYQVDDVEVLEIAGKNYYQLELEAKGKKDLQLVLSPAGEEQDHISYWD